MKWIVAAFALLIVAFAFDLGLLVYAIYALLAIFLAARYVTSRWSGNVEGSRTVSATRAEIGDTIEVGIGIENLDRWPITWMLVEDMLPIKAHALKLPLTIDGDRVAVLEFSGSERHQLNYRLKCERRGYFQIGPTVIETGDMFGFNRRFKVINEPAYLMVYPKIISLGGYDIASRRPIGEVIMTNRLFEDPTRIAGVRDYQAGDPMNRIHWKKSASTGKLQSKIYEPSSMAGATILLDFNNGAFDPKHEPVRSELAITAAASIAAALVEMGQQVGLVSNGRDAVDRIATEGWQGDERTRDIVKKSVAMKSENDRLEPVIVPTLKSVEQSIRINRALARLELSDGMDLGTLIVEAGSRLPRDATVIAIVAEMNMENAIALGNLKKQGYSVVAVVNTYSEERFAQTKGPLFGEGIGAMHLKDESSIRSICERQAMMI
jgi:uncharacterized protein (DUF58 family)